MLLPIGEQCARLDFCPMIMAFAMIDDEEMPNETVLGPLQRENLP
jgi:hypothetical protein